MFTIESNITSVSGWFERLAQSPGSLEAGYGAAVVGRWGMLDVGLFRAAAQGALTAAMLPAEFKWLAALLATVSVVLPGMGEVEVAMGRPPNVVERAAHAAGAIRKVFNRGRPGYLGKGITRGEAEEMEVRTRGVTPEELSADAQASRDLIRAWLAEPFTDRKDPASGKERKPVDAGYTDEEITDRLVWILGLSPTQAARHRSHEMELAAGALARALGRFAAARSPQNEAIPEARLRDLFRAVLASWRALLRQHLPKAAHDALLDMRESQ